MPDVDLMETTNRAAAAAADLIPEQPRRGYDCPAQRAIDSIADKWKLQILFVLAHDGVVRFRELQRRLDGVSQKVLTGALRELESDGLITRTVYAEVPPRVEYRPSDRVGGLLPILAQLHRWAESQ